MKKVLMTLLAAAIFCLPAGAWARISGHSSAQDMLIRSQVETAVSMLQILADKQTQGEMSLDEAKKLGADLLRNMSYGRDGYFWADTNDGVNVVLYGRKDTEGRNRLEDKDTKGVYYIKEFLRKAKSGGGYVEYIFTRKGKTEPLAKRAYVLPFAPFGWVIGTGYYRTDIVHGKMIRSSDALTRAVAGLDADILNILNGLGNTLSLVAKEAGKTGLDNEAEIRKLLQKNYNDGQPHVINSAFIDGKGMMKMIEPDKYHAYEGSDISQQEAVIKMLKIKKPRMGNLFLAVEGIKSVDIESPVFSKEKQFLGSISILIKPDELIRSAAAAIEKDAGVQCWVMQKNGVILYETDPAQTGLNIFSDDLYKNYPELIALGKRMVKEEKGKGFYTFQSPGTNRIVKKQAAWKTIHFFNNDWIVAAYREIKQ